MRQASRVTAAVKPIKSRSHQAITIHPSLATSVLRSITFTLATLAIATLPTPAWCADAAATAPRFIVEWGGRGAENGQFDFPIGIVINRADDVFVTDFYNARVQKFSNDGTFLAAFSVSPFPGGIALDRDENIYVTHAGIPPSRYDEPRKRDKIAVFSPDGNRSANGGSSAPATAISTCRAES